MNSIVPLLQEFEFLYSVSTRSTCSVLEHLLGALTMDTMDTLVTEHMPEAEAVQST